MEEVDSTLASWQPMVASGIGGNRELILQLNSRIEVLENQVTSLLNERARADGRRGGREEDGRGGREYVRIAREGAEDEVAEVPTNSEGLLPMQTVKALFDGTSAIKYRVEGRRTWRALLLEAELYHSPEDGWGERVYLCTAPQVPSQCVFLFQPPKMKSTTKHSKTYLSGHQGASGIVGSNLLLSNEFTLGTCSFTLGTCPPL